MMLPVSLSWGPTLGSKNTFLPRKFENPVPSSFIFLDLKPIHEAYIPFNQAPTNGWFKVTFWFPSCRSLNLSKWSQKTIPKRAPAELPGMGFSLFGLIYFIDFGGSTKWHPGIQSKPPQVTTNSRHPNAEIGFLTNQGISIFKTIAEARYILTLHEWLLVVF